MPELPEVETVVRDLRPRVTGCRLAAVRKSRMALRKPWDASWNRALTGRQVQAIDRRGKWILLALDRDGFLVIHLGMTGQLTVAPAKQKMDNHTHLIFDLDKGANQLRFRDIRRFGSATYFPDRAGLDDAFAASGLGPEPFDLEAAYWRERLGGTERSLKAILLDQQVVAGVGNIYADESLFHARLAPALRGCDLKRVETERLRRAIVTVLNRAIDRRGSTIRDYVGGTGQRGGYQREFRVYGRTGEPCPRCKTPIARVRLAGRSTHYCPQCQQSRDR